MERVFSGGRLLLTHTRSALSSESTRAVLCLHQWSEIDLVRDDDLEVAARLEELDGEDSVPESDIDDDALAISDSSSDHETDGDDW